MARKRFLNKTGYRLSTELSVRQGDRPGVEKDIVTCTLEKDADTYVDYGDSGSPFMDGLSVTPINANGISPKSVKVKDKSSITDNNFNQNDTIVIFLDKNAVTFSFTNTWTV
jgi:hypothetical protein